MVKTLETVLFVFCLEVLVQQKRALPGFETLAGLLIRPTFLTQEKIKI